MLEKLKNAIYFSLNELFTLAAVGSMTEDTPAHREVLEQIARIADILGIETEMTTISLAIMDNTEDE